MFAELYALIEKTVIFLKTTRREEYEGKDEETLRWKGGRGEKQSSGGLEYVTGYAIPNFMFDAVTVVGWRRWELGRTIDREGHEGFL